MVNVRVLQLEVSAIGRAATWLPLRLVERSAAFDPNVPHPTPVVFAHGFLGDRTNFRAVKQALAGRGVTNVAYFDYGPRIDWPRLATRLGHVVSEVCRETGVRRVDVVGHSFGGLVARYLVDMAPEAPVRRLVTLGSPYFGSPLPPKELAIFGEHDPIVPLPHPVYGPHAPHLRPGGRVVVVPDCGHWGLLVHERVTHEVTRFLTSPDLALTHGDQQRRFDFAS
ncbi:MAG TPA: alpha/beta fold hydrolase [Candidatus Eisenbacteria bacterium]|nr:alpha/beta fold hydrolase [Candidatus Eisenbacteria bacterium]